MFEANSVFSPVQPRVLKIRKDIDDFKAFFVSCQPDLPSTMTMAKAVARSCRDGSMRKEVIRTTPRESKGTYYVRTHTYNTYYTRTSSAGLRFLATYSEFQVSTSFTSFNHITVALCYVYNDNFCCLRAVPCSIWNSREAGS